MIGSICHKVDRINLAYCIKDKGGQRRHVNKEEENVLQTALNNLQTKV